MTHSPKRLRDFAQRYTAAWCSQNPASVAAFFSPNGSLCANDGDLAVGRSAITEFARGFMTTFPDMMVRMDELRLPGERATDAETIHATYHWTLTGTNAGPGGTGNRVRITGFEEWQIGADGFDCQVARAL